MGSPESNLINGLAAGFRTTPGGKVPFFLQTLGGGGEFGINDDTIGSDGGRGRAGYRFRFRDRNLLHLASMVRSGDRRRIRVR